MREALQIYLGPKMVDDDTVAVNINEILKNINKDTKSYQKQVGLIHLNGAFQGRKHVLEAGRQYVIGRNEQSDIFLNHNSISRNHATVYVDQNYQLVLCDQESSNGSFINSQPLIPKKKYIVQDGDKLQFGSEIVLKAAIMDAEESAFQDSMYEAAVKDSMTKIYNKKYFLEDLEREVALANRHGKHVSLILFDIDFFKKINDTHGHQAGDFILTKTSEIISKGLRIEDVFSRYGGEEFAIIVKNLPLKDAVKLAERIRSYIGSGKYKFAGKIINVTMSFGVVSTSVQKFKNAEDIIRSADEFLYEAKEGGRNRVEYPKIEGNIIKDAV